MASSDIRDSGMPSKRVSGRKRGYTISEPQIRRRERLTTDFRRRDVEASRISRLTIALSVCLLI